MRLAKITVRNYRSITSPSTIPVRSSLTVLIGPNNEGKSNVLRALSLSLTALQRLSKSRFPIRPRLVTHPSHAAGLSLPTQLLTREYDWAKDYPMSLQEHQPDGESVFGLQFKLNADEREEFHERVGSSINDSLPVQLQIGPVTSVFRVKKQGPGAAKLSRQAFEICAFICEKLRLQYIPAVRTARSAVEVVEQMLETELATIEQDPLYVAALEQIETLQKPILDKVAAQISATLQEFIPDVAGVRVAISKDRRYRQLRTAGEVFVDDGWETPLDAKGDGVVSLAAIGLMRYAAESSKAPGSLVLAIEEPESHLHPAGIHQLQRVIREIAEQHQVIITTHNPILVEKRDVGSNIIVSKQRASAARSISAVRETLGVRVGDNLTNAEVVLMVEGPHDETALSALLAHSSERLRVALSDGQFAVDVLRGCKNLSAEITHVVQAMCLWHCLLDDDQAGRDAFKRAQDSGLASTKEVTLTRVRRHGESEFEDWINPGIYCASLESIYGPVLQCSEFKSGRGKWSERMRRAFEETGKHWDDKVELDVKRLVADSVAAAPDAAIHDGCTYAFESLVSALEALLITR